MEWNRLTLARILATREGRLCHRQALVSVSRQNSKTTMCEGLVGWLLTDYTDNIAGEPQTIGWLSHDLKLTEQAFVFLARLLEPHVHSALYSFGRQRLEMRNGSVFTVVSNSMNAGHGWSFDWLIADEAWRIKPEAISHGVLPAMRARPQPMLIMLSTAGDEDSTLLKQWRERGLSLIESGDDSRFAFLEWSPPPGVDLLSEPQWWAWSNPCLGTTLTDETLLDEYHAPDRNGFLRGALNTWIQTQASWLEPGWWQRCLTKSMPEPAGGVIAAEVSQGGDRFVATRSWNVNGVTYVQPLCSTEYEDVLWTLLDEAYGDIDTLAITPTLEPHLPPGMKRKSITVGIKELARSVPLVRGMVAAGQVAHPGHALLDEHIGRAVMTRSAGLSTAHSSGPIEMARCAVWSTTLASRPQWRRKPSIGYSTE